MTFGSRLKSLRQEKGLTQAQFGEYFNLAESTISLYETEKRTPHHETLKRFALFLNVSLDYLFGLSENRYISEAIGELPQNNYAVPNTERPVRISVVQKLVSIKGIISYEYISDAEEWLPYQHVKDGHYFWLVTSDNSFTGEAILPGDMLLVREQASLASGDLAVVMVDDDSYSIRRIYISEDNLLLQAANPDHPPLMLSKKASLSPRIVGKVLQVKRSLSAKK